RPMQALVRTRGTLGSAHYIDGAYKSIPAIAPKNIVDPTVWGDAHRDGLMYGLINGWDIYEACCLANVMGSIKIATKGPQNHNIDKEEINRILKLQYELKRSI